MHYVDVGLFSKSRSLAWHKTLLVQLSSVAFLACDAFNFVSFHLDDLFTREEEE
jgi:hypothetical protein